MRLVSARQEALYRGYRIEGMKEGQCTALRVIPTRPDLPSLEYSRFRSFPRGTWGNAVEVVCGYVDQALGDRTSLSHRRTADLSPKKNPAQVELGIGTEVPTPSGASSPPVLRR
jgi:hypothetical protein